MSTSMSWNRTSPYLPPIVSDCPMPERNLGFADERMKLPERGLQGMEHIEPAHQPHVFPEPAGLERLSAIVAAMLEAP